MRLIAERFPVTRIADGPEDSRSLACADATVEAMRAGAPIIAQAVLRNPETRTYGVADLLVRSDVLNELVPGTLTAAEARVPAPALGDVAVALPGRRHQVPHARRSTRSATARPYDELSNMAQVWVYNEALGRLQGFTPPAAFLLGRNWTCGWSARQRLLRAPRPGRPRRDRRHADRRHAGRADDRGARLGPAPARRWRRVAGAARAVGAGALPARPQHSSDAPWHSAKRAHRRRARRADAAARP